MLPRLRSHRTHESVFLERYRLLVDRARRLADGDDSRAEDLVQSLFVHFTLMRPDLDEIENLDAYLHVMLRNLHVSQRRRADRANLVEVSLADFDSAALALRNADELTVLHVRDQLRRICEYACRRRESSKAGSALLLRFFHGYYPGEIARVLATSPAAVSENLRLARAEARAYLDDPSKLQFFRGTHAFPALPASGANPDYLAALQQAIFGHRHPACPSGYDLEALYAPGAKTIDHATLAGLVCCRICLDHVNRHLGLPLLADRSPYDSLGRRPTGGDHTGGPASPGTGGPGPGDVEERCRRRAREVFEHRPRELRLSANGFIVGTQQVGLRRHTQSVGITLVEPLRFVEVISEQGVRLMLVAIAPPPEGAVEQGAALALSGGRSLEVAVSFAGAWPVVRLSYADPGASEQDAASAVAPARPPQAAGTASWWRRLTSQFDRPWWRRPIRLTAMATVVVTIGLLLLPLRHDRISAATVLRQAAASERALARSVATVRRSIRLESRTWPDGTGIESRRIEIASSRPRRLSVRRVYETGGLLQAGEWLTADGARTVRPRGATSRSEPVASDPLATGEIWRLDPSVTIFERFGLTPDRLQLDERDDRVTLSFRAGVEAAAARILEVDLTLRRPDFHPIGLRLVLSSGAGAIEHRFDEERLEQVASSPAESRLFEIEPELRWVPKLDAAPRSTPPALPPVVPPDAAPHRERGEVELDTLEMEAWHRLHRLDACVLDAAFAREPGQLHLRLSAQTERERQVMEQTLLSLTDRGVVLSLGVDGGRARAEKPVPRTSAIWTAFRGLLARQVTRDADRGALDAAADRLATWTLERSHSRLRESRALLALTTRWSDAELAALDLDTAAKWHGMVWQHARALEHETETLRAQLRPAFISGEPSARDADPPPAATAALRADIARLTQLVQQQHETLVRLAASADAGDPRALDESLEDARVLARRTAQPRPIGRQ